MNKSIIKSLLAVLLTLSVTTPGNKSYAYDFKAVVLTENGGQHEGFVNCALKWLKWSS